MADASDLAGVTALAKKAGCAAPEVKPAKAGTDGAKAGATAGANCKADGNEYLFVWAKNTAALPALVKSFGGTVSGGKVFYVLGPTWLALAGKDGGDPTEAGAKVLQSKVGGEVKSVG